MDGRSASANWRLVRYRRTDEMTKEVEMNMTEELVKEIESDLGLGDEEGKLVVWQDGDFICVRTLDWVRLRKEEHARGGRPFALPGGSRWVNEQLVTKRRATSTRHLLGRHLRFVPGVRDE